MAAAESTGRLISIPRTIFCVVSVVALILNILYGDPNIRFRFYFKTLATVIREIVLLTFTKIKIETLRFKSTKNSPLVLES